MNNIPLKLKNEIKNDPFYKTCCLKEKDCRFENGHRPIEWHHVVIFAGRQLQEKWAILPACSGYHHKFANRRDIRDRFLRIAVARANKEELGRVSKVINYSKYLE